MTLKAPNTNTTKLKVKIKVICRVRPVMKGEREDGTVQVDRDQKSLSIVNQRQPEEVLKYGFDNCYDMTGTQQEIYSENLLPILKDVFKGMDATVFCYGMTGAGKTHTIQGTQEDPGLIPRCMKDIFEYRDKFLKADTITSQGNGRPHTFEVRVSYMEIYLEAVFDLLRPRDKNSRAGLAIREDANRNVFVSGLEIRLVNSYEEFEVEYSKGCKNRATAVTLLNQASSRSHAILGIEIKIEDATTGKSFRSKLNMIDLAGSEDNRRTGNTNLRLNESSSINQSLHALGKVVDAINNRASQIPYRDSKMTRILQSTLGGRSLGMMIVNIAPGKAFFPETHRALNFATKSKEIVNNTVFNETTEPNIVRNVNLETLQVVKPTLLRSDSRSKSTILKPLALKRKSLSVNSLKPLDPQTSADDKVMQDLASSLPLTAKSGNAKALIEMAQKFLTEQRTEDAYRCYKHALIFAPNNPVALNAIHKLDSEELKSSIKLETKEGLIKRTFSGLTRRTTTTPSPNKKPKGVTLVDSPKPSSTPPDPNPSVQGSPNLPVKVDTDTTSGFVKKFVPRRRLTKVEEGTLPDQDQRNLSSISETFHPNLSLPNQSRPLRSVDISRSRSMTDVLASSPEVTPIAKRKIKPLTTQVLSDCSFFSDSASPVELDPSYSDFIVLSDDDDSDDSLITTPLKPKRKPPAPKSIKPDLKVSVLEDATRVQELKGILVDTEHPLVALVNMGNPDLLKGLWPHGLKTRQHIADFIKSTGPITSLQDLIPTAITEKVLLKSLAKLHP